MSSPRWKDSYLDTLRALGDPLADQHLQKPVADNEITNIRKVFAEIDSNNEILPATTFPELNAFFSSTHNLPSTIDTKRIDRGEMVFQKNAFTGALRGSGDTRFPSRQRCGHSRPTSRAAGGSILEMISTI